MILQSFLITADLITISANTIIREIDIICQGERKCLNEKCMFGESLTHAFCEYGLYYDHRTDRTYCYGHGWVMNGNIEHMPILITEEDYNAIMDSVNDKGVKLHEI